MPYLFVCCQYGLKGFLLYRVDYSSLLSLFVVNPRLPQILASLWAGPLGVLCAFWLPHRNPPALYCVACVLSIRPETLRLSGPWRLSINVSTTVKTILLMSLLGPFLNTNNSNFNNFLSIKIIRIWYGKLRNIESTKGKTINLKSFFVSTRDDNWLHFDVYSNFFPYVSFLFYIYIFFLVFLFYFIYLLIFY